ncbi:hypothetical protein M514_08356 [Trichuris suis]|uniref:Uncharacterized protein n=1 Tax=Trichuris suis TaxID=68888 RepID=A0A085N154_9BILA|nr:hypothetical protein M514_08356 [Trichuris suis]
MDASSIPCPLAEVKSLASFDELDQCALRGPSRSGYAHLVFRNDTETGQSVVSAHRGMIMLAVVTLALVFRSRSFFAAGQKFLKITEIRPIPGASIGRVSRKMQKEHRFNSTRSLRLK